MQAVLEAPPPKATPPIAMSSPPPRKVDPALRDAALAYHRVGLCVLPTVAGEKRPAGHWKQYIEKRPDEAATSLLFASAAGLCIVCGPVSGHVECLDFDNAGSAFPAWTERIPRDLFERLALEQSPSGGFHVAYRCPDAVLVDNTRKLARDEAGRCLIETRGTGAVFLCDPTPGYRLVQGCFTSLPVLSPDERDVLLNAAVALNRFVPAPVAVTETTTPAIPPGVMHPYAAKALAEECAAVAAAVEGSRNDALNVAAVKLGHYVGGGALSESFVRSELSKAAAVCGLGAAEIATTLDSGLRKGMAEPKTVPAQNEPPLVDMSALLAKVGAGAPPRVEPMNPEKHPGWRLTFMNTITPQPVRWLWPGRIALGKLNMLIGDPGLGKSFITCDLAARVSTGAPWPDGAANDGPGGVLLLNAEDGKADTIRPRLDAARADVSRVAVLDAISGDHRLLSLARHVEVLVQCAAAVPDLRLIIVDPVSSFMGGVDSHKNTDVREVLAPLSDLAETLGAAVLAVTHLNKGQGPAVYRATGSLAFTAAARSVWAVAKDKRDRERRLLLPVKNNLGNDKTGLAYSINGFSNPPFVEWDPAPVELDADDALNFEPGQSPSSAPRRAQTAAVDEWLEAFLEGGERPAGAVYEAGAAAGFSEDQLKRARPRIGALTQRVGMPARSVWRLPADESDAEDESAGTPSRAADACTPQAARRTPCAPGVPSASRLPGDLRQPEGAGTDHAPAGGDDAPCPEEPVLVGAESTEPTRLRSFPFA